MAGSPGPSAVEPGCTTQRQNAHGTEIAEGRTVAYWWHPWVGQAVHVHQIIEKTTGPLARCSLAVDPIVRTQDIPLWMLDETVCRATRAMSHPFAALEALAALRSLLSNVRAAQASARTAEGATIASPDQHRGDRHGTPSPSPASDTGSSTRPLRERAVDAQGGARLEHAAASDAERGDRAGDPPAHRARRRRDPQSAGRRR